MYKSFDEQQVRIVGENGNVMLFFFLKRINACIFYFIYLSYSFESYFLIITVFIHQNRPNFSFLVAYLKCSIFAALPFYLYIHFVNFHKLRQNIKFLYLIKPTTVMNYHCNFLLYYSSFYHHQFPCLPWLKLNSYIDCLSYFVFENYQYQ